MGVIVLELWFSTNFDHHQNVVYKNASLKMVVLQLTDTAIIWVVFLLELSAMHMILKLLTPSVYALHQMAHICENYAMRYDIIFNAKKVRLSFIKLTM